MAFREVFKRLLGNKKQGSNTQFEQTLLVDRLSHFDEQINNEWEQFKTFDFIQIESDSQTLPRKPQPIKLKSDNPKLIDRKLKQWADLRKKSNIASNELIDGINLLLDYGIWTDNIIAILDEYINNETTVYSTDAQSIILSLLEFSIRTIKNEIEEDFESNEIFDFENYFETHLRVPLNVAGFYDLKFSQTAQPWSLEDLIEYTLNFEWNHLMVNVKLQSDGDFFLLIRTILNGIFLKSGSNYRIYRMENCCYPIVLEKDLALQLMKHHGILLFHENWY